MSGKRAVRGTRLDSKDAINAVLEAERLTMDAVDACESRAREIVEAARETARRIARRTDRRIAAVHGRKPIPDTVANPPEPAPSPRPEQALTDRQITALRDAAERLAERLTTAGTDDDAA